MHSLNFGAAAGDYYKYANDEILVVLQTESPEGVANAREIYSLPGVDAIFVGPNDLKFQMRNETADGSDPTPEEFEAMLQRILSVGKEVGTPVGLHVVTVEDAQRRADEGWQFIAMASELKFMVNEATRVVKTLNIGSAGDLARY